jgi:uncharacterized RDD family membrane protein YckC
MLSFLLDVGAIGGVVAIPYCTPAFPKIGSLGFLVSFFSLYFAYLVVGLIKPSFGIGKSAQNISVVRLTNAEKLSPGQATTRTAVRCSLALTGLSLSKAAEVDAIAIAPILVEVLFMYLHPLRQTISDIAAGSVVITMPPSQPHRAPAAPMFSRNDAEFGNRDKERP